MVKRSRFASRRRPSKAGRTPPDRASCRSVRRTEACSDHRPWRDRAAQDRAYHAAATAAGSGLVARATPFNPRRPARQRISRAEQNPRPTAFPARPGSDAGLLELTFVGEALECVPQRVLRRWPKAAATIAAKSPSSATCGRASRNGARRATADSTFGAGRNAPAGTVNSRSTRKRACSITESRRIPACRALRPFAATSRCSITVRSFTLSSNCARWKRIGVEMLYGRLPMTRNCGPSAAKSKVSASASCSVRRAGGYCATTLAARS